MIGLCCLLPAIYYYLSGKTWLAVFLLFFLMTAGFQMLPLHWMVMPSLGITKSYDWILLFTGAILLLKPQIFAAFLYIKISGYWRFMVYSCCCC